MAIFGPAAAAELVDPPVLTSSHGVLDVLMVARAAPASSLVPFSPTAWVYDICYRPADGADSCPTGIVPVNLYGGTRLALRPGDLLRIRLVNKLPPITDSDHASQPGHAYLALNPTNIHTHGMLVSPRFPTVDDPTYGDTVFVLTLNPANGAPPPDSMIHGDLRVGYTDYEIRVPTGHPSGLFWFHPHVHGVALNQVSAGLSGLITVGSITDYVCADSSCTGFLNGLKTRHILLKDTQVRPDGTLLDQEDPDFCTFMPAAHEPPRRGSCAGVSHTDDGGGNYVGGRWFFTLNGQPYPNMSMGPGGEIWRITTASGSASYDLAVNLPAERRDLIIQVLAIDGVAVTRPRSTPSTSLTTLGGTRFQAVACPKDLPPAPAAAGGDDLPLCVSRLVMMPSSRVEVWVAYRDAAGRIASPPAGARAVLKTAGRQTGPDGDSWPTVNLASIDITAPPLAAAPQTLKVSGAARTLADPRALARSMSVANALIRREADCAPLAPGHHRRIFFNTPSDDPDSFGLGYEEVDQNGQPVPGTFVDVHAFDPTTPTICVPLGANDSPVHEKWELINLAGEDHNFHIHQVKFSVVGRDTLSGGALPAPGVLLDNVPLRHALGACASVADWRENACVAYPVVVDIPFAIAGDFVYHCHILEHEDGGMMARIRVRSGRPAAR